MLWVDGDAEVAWPRRSGLEEFAFVEALGRGGHVCAMWRSMTMCQGQPSCFRRARPCPKRIHTQAFELRGRGRGLVVCIWCIWCCIFTPHEPPQAAVLLNTKGLPSGLDRTRGVVEHCRAPVQEEQPQRTPADGGPHGGRPLTSKPRRRRVSHLSQTGYKQGTGLGTGV